MNNMAQLNICNSIGWIERMIVVEFNNKFIFNVVLFQNLSNF